MHGPCGITNKKSPCIVNGHCSKHFPKQFNERTILYEDRYPRNKRRDIVAMIKKNGIPLDNKFIVP